MANVTFHIISHTHWDREWYLPFEKFRFELVELVDRLLNILEQDREFIFHLDGQSIILEDYLQIKPYKKEQIQRFVKDGRLLVGPWYVLSDQFLSSGESTIRNLLYGIGIAKEFGQVMKVGYCVDQFGHIAQLPQILRNFGIDSAVIGRGIQDGLAEHVWYSLNGDSILVLSLTKWYNNAQRIPAENTHQYLDKIYESQVNSSKSGHILLMNGCDHIFPQADLSHTVKSSGGNNKWELKQDSIENALKIISNKSENGNYPICFGELRDDNNKFILAGTLSSRVYLKLANYRCQNKLEKIIEPLLSLVEISALPELKSALPEDLWSSLKYAWKLLIQNHAHDSICGCSTDEVHREMEIRFLKAEQVIDKVRERLLQSIGSRESGRDGRSYVQIINLTNYKRNEIIEAELEFPLGPISKDPSTAPIIDQSEVKSLKLVKDGKTIPVEIIESHNIQKMIRSAEEIPLLQVVQKVKVLFAVDVEPFSVSCYEVQLSKEKQGNSTNKFISDNYIIEFNKNGTVNLKTKENDCLFEDLHSLSIEDDIGDEYNFVPSKEGRILSSKDWKWNIKTIEENNFRKRVFLTAENDLDLDFRTEITCYRNTTRIDFKTKIKNNLKNKRIRLHFPTKLGTNYAACDTPFGVLLRSRPPVNWINYAFTQPLYNWIDQSNAISGLSFFSGGLADYELYEDGNGFSVTLIRAVGRLSSVKSHSLIETPEAHCRREIEYCYSIYPHSGTWEEANVNNESLLSQSQLFINQSYIPFSVKNMINVSGKVSLSAFKRSENKNSLYILRLFNPYSEEVSDCNVKLNFLFKNLYLLNLNEEILSSIQSNSGSLSLSFKPFEIITLGIQL